LWLFIRDVHIYAVITTLVLIIPLLFIRKYRQIKILTAVIIFLIALFIVGNYSSKLSPRWQPSLTHVLDYYILPYPARVEFFSKYGMPGNFESEEYKTWFNQKGIQTYGLFLLTHPGFILNSTLDISSYLKSDFIQPHFKSPDNPYRGVLLILGEAIHPETNAIYIMDLILVFSLCIMAIMQGDKITIAWAWLALWVLIYSAISLFISLFGDIDGTRRHIFPSVELFRLFLWIFLVVQIDQAIAKKSSESSLS